MKLDDYIRKLTRGTSKVKLPGGIVGKTCYLLMAVAAALAAIVAAVHTESVGFAAIAAIVIIVLPLTWRLIGFAERHPDAAILEGGEWVAYQIQLAQKGVGELPMDIPGPAVAAAVKHATGRLIPTLPHTPERIAKALS